MKVLVAPLNWGLGHATRCIPLVRQYLAAGDEVVIGGDGVSVRRLRQAFPTLRTIELSPLDIRYSKSNSQVWAMLRALPQLIRMSVGDHRRLLALQAAEGFDLIVSDNRFGLYTEGVKCVYMTHQLYLRLPRGWRWAEGIATFIHRLIWRHYDEVWVPDYEAAEHSLSGRLSHRGQEKPNKVKYIGPLSRLQPAEEADTRYEVVALLSGIEPQRTLLEEQVRKEYAGSKEQVLIIRGKVGEPQVEWHRGNITLLPQADDKSLAALLEGAQTIICRSGYSTLMDLATLGVLHKARLIPTPGQSEQEYLARYIQTSNL